MALGGIVDNTHQSDERANVARTPERASLLATEGPGPLDLVLIQRL